HFSGHWRLLRLLPYNLHGQLLEIAQHGYRQLEDLDLALELGLESLERNRILYLVARKAIDVDRSGRLVKHPPQIDRQRLVGLFVEGELHQRAWLVPARVIVVACRIVQAQFHVIMRPNPLGGVDYTPFERRVDVGARGEDGRAARLSDDLAA